MSLLCTSCCYSGNEDSPIEISRRMPATRKESASKAPAIQVQPYPPFMDKKVQEDVINRFTQMVQDGKWNECDTWIYRFPKYKQEYYTWKKMFLEYRESVINQQLDHSAPARPPRAKSASGKVESDGYTSQQVKASVQPDGPVEEKKTEDKSIHGKLAVDEPKITEEQLWANFRETLTNENIGKIGPLLSGPLCKEDLDNELTMLQYKKYEEWATLQGKYPAFAKTFPKRQRELFYNLIDQKAYGDARVWMSRFPQWKNDFEIYIREKQDSEPSNLTSSRISHNNEPTAPTAISPKEPTEEDKSLEKLKTLAAEVTNSLPKDTNILMLGETGTGKSTFINAMANYFKSENFEKASAGQLVTLVPTRFQLCDYENRQHDIHVKPNVTTRSAAEQNAEYTTKPKIYSFTYKNGNKEQTIKVMDTPGLGDPKGIEYDKQTFENILNAIEQFDELHAICILMRPNESVMTAGFRYCIHQLLSQLHVSAVQNIFFCFTFANSTNYRPGQTVQTLGAIFDKMGLEGEMKHLEKNRVFCFDNEAIKFLMAKDHGFEFSHGEDKRLSESYIKSSFELFRMLLEMKCREPHNPRSTIHLNATRKLLNRLVKPLVEVTRNLVLNEMYNRQLIQQIEDNRPDLLSQLKVKKIEQRMVKLETPRMVCTSQKCLGHNFKSGFKAVEYKTVCHYRCLQKEESDLVPNPLLEECTKIKNGICKECGCSWKEHKHLSYEIEQNIIEYDNEKIRSQLASNMLRKNLLEKKIAEAKQQLNEVVFFVDTFGEFSLFLSDNSITNYSDVFMMYINQAIAEESHKHDTLPTSTRQKDPLLDALIFLKSEYQNTLDQMRMKQVRALSVEKINSLIKEMIKIGGCEALVDEILSFKAEMEKVAKRAEEEIEVTYPDGFLGGAIYK